MKQNLRADEFGDSMLKHPKPVLSPSEEFPSCSLTRSTSTAPCPEMRSRTEPIHVAPIRTAIFISRWRSLPLRPDVDGTPRIPRLEALDGFLRNFRLRDVQNGEIRMIVKGDHDIVRNAGAA